MINDKIKEFIKENEGLINSNRFEELYKSISVFDRTHLPDVLITCNDGKIEF